MLTLVVREVTQIQWDVFKAYGLALSTRGVGLRVENQPPNGPCLFSTNSPLPDKTGHCYWEWNDVMDVVPDADGCAWIWHHGPRRDLAESDPRIILLPRNDVFEVRTLDNSPQSWADYRSRIGVPWDAKRGEIYFLGFFTGPPDESNARLRAFRALQESGLPRHVGVVPLQLPEQLAAQLPLLNPEPLWAMAHYKYILSLWGNHPFNPRLYRGLEGGSLVFHQATPTVRFLDDGLLEPGRHYVELLPDQSDLVDKLAYYMGHPAEAREIAAEGHAAWVRNYQVQAPYNISDVIWERFVGQPRWAEFRATFDVY